MLRSRLGIVLAVLLSISPLVSPLAHAQRAGSVGGCDIRRGTLCTNANLNGAQLAGVNLSNSQFTRSDLSGADLSGANLDQAIFLNTQTEGCIGCP